LNKARFDPRVSLFFSNYLIDRKIQYVWKNFISPSFRTNVGVDQDSALSFILSALYIVLIFHIFEKRTQNLLSTISVSTLSFINNNLFIS